MQNFTDKQYKILEVFNRYVKMGQIDAVPATEKSTGRIVPLLVAAEYMENGVYQVPIALVFDNDEYIKNYDLPFNIPTPPAKPSFWGRLRGCFGKRK